MFRVDAHDRVTTFPVPAQGVLDEEEHVGGVVTFGAPGQACSMSNAARLRASLLNSTPIRWIGSPRSR